MPSEAYIVADRCTRISEAVYAQDVGADWSALARMARAAMRSARNVRDVTPADSAEWRMLDRAVRYAESAAIVAEHRAERDTSKAAAELRHVATTYYDAARAAGTFARGTLGGDLYDTHLYVNDLARVVQARDVANARVRFDSFASDVRETVRALAPAFVAFVS